MMNIYDVSKLVKTHGKSEITYVGVYVSTLTDSEPN